MFIPIGDDNPTERTPFVNYALIAANVAAFLIFGLGPPGDPGAIRWAAFRRTRCPACISRALQAACFACSRTAPR